LLLDRHRLAADPGRLDAEFRLAARRGGMGENLEACRHHRPHRAVAPGISGIVQPSGAETCELARTCEKRTLHFIGVVKHRTSSECLGGMVDVAVNGTGCKRMLHRNSSSAGPGGQLRRSGHTVREPEWPTPRTAPRADR